MCTRPGARISPNGPGPPPPAAADDEALASRALIEGLSAAVAPEVPAIVYVLPAPVWPKAKTVAACPPSALSISTGTPARSKKSSCVTDGSKAASKVKHLLMPCGVCSSTDRPSERQAMAGLVPVRSCGRMGLRRATTVTALLGEPIGRRATRPRPTPGVHANGPPPLKA
jgi:hypothetical protein